MRAPIVSLILSLHFFTLTAQKSPIKYGDVSISDLEMTTYEADSSAVAVIISDYGKAYVSFSDVSSQLFFDKHIRIKILKSDGTRWSDGEIPLFSGNSRNDENITKFKATAYNLVDGEIEKTEIDERSLQKVKFNKFFDLKKFSIPNVKVGTVIEYSYTIQSDLLVNFPNWQFQYEIPSMHSEYWAIIPEFFIMEKYTQGYLSPSVFEATERTQSFYHETANHWIYKNVPAFKPEPFMTSKKDYVTKINFALAYIDMPNRPPVEIMGTWDKLVSLLKNSDSFGNAISGSGFLNKIVEPLIANLSSDEEKVKAIHNYVKSNIEWNGEEDYVAGNLKSILENKTGSSGDINILLASMLEKAGFKPDMVLLSTREHGFIRVEYPMSRQMNYVVCRLILNNDFIFLDATEKFIPINTLPERCLNGQGLLVSETNRGWVQLQTKVKTKTIYAANITISAQAEASGTITKTSDGYSAQELRRKHKKLGLESFKNSEIHSLKLAVNDWKLEDIDKEEKPVKEVFDVNIEELVTQSGDVVYIEPLLGLQLKENPFKQDKREYPVDYGSTQEQLFIIKYSIHDEFVVEELPQSIMYVLPDKSGRFTLSAQTMGNTINIMVNFQINRTLYVGTEYADLKEFYNHCVAKQNEQIVLKRKS
ncbi:MAG: transglutaminase-like domain-containing protein [Cyclobacteriaceae bacterium]|jgi:hypothetical protein|nr:transglutaminase-like domain-containing protein [Cyclobacteriaceae bacterium]